MFKDMHLKDWFQIFAVLAGFTAQAVIVRNDVDWIKQTLLRHETLIMTLIAKGK